MANYTDSETLYAARRHEALFSGNIPEGERPVVHLPARIGWMNDPNGFSWFDGEYHLFYQYYPYDTKWGPMHWGHAKSADLIHWVHLPAALAPDQPYDGFGCFSGSALELPDGRHMIMYTGVMEKGKNADGTIECWQTQCVAFGDGTNYKKYEGNPVIDSSQLPEGLDIQNFRDPKIWLDEQGVLHCVVGACNAVGHEELSSGRILEYRSNDGLTWEFERVFAENNGRVGSMWECPDTFELDGKQVLLVSPQDMLADSNEFASGNGTLAIIGTRDPQTGALVEEAMQSIDYGLDFYATQTLLSPDGRRIMVAWMQNWDAICMSGRKLWFGQMAIPRELSVRNGKLIQWPVREIEAARRNRVAYQGVEFSGECELEGIEGRCIDLSVVVRPANEDESYNEFTIWFAHSGQFHSSIRFRPADRLLKINRKHSGLRRAVVKDRKCVLESYTGELRLRLILDRASAEVFVGDGEKALTMTIPTDPTMGGISFFADGNVVMDVEKFDLV